MGIPAEGDEVTRILKLYGDAAEAWGRAPLLSCEREQISMLRCVMLLVRLTGYL